MNQIKCIAFDCFGTVFDMLPISHNEISEYVKHVRSDNFSPYTFPQSWYELKAHPDSKAGIDMLQNEGYFCVALSNGSFDLIEHISRNNGILFNYIVDLSKHKVYKPHKKAYLAIKKDLGYNTQDTLMVTANPTFGDIEGAKSVDMQSIVIRHGFPSDIIQLYEYLIKKK